MLDERKLEGCAELGTWCCLRTLSSPSSSTGARTTSILNILGPDMIENGPHKGDPIVCTYISGIYRPNRVTEFLIRPKVVTSGMASRPRVTPVYAVSNVWPSVQVYVSW